MLWILLKLLQINCNIFKQTNWTRKSWVKTANQFIGKLERDNGAAMLFIIEKSQETTFKFSQNSVSMI